MSHVKVMILRCCAVFAILALVNFLRLVQQITREARRYGSCAEDICVSR